MLLPIEYECQTNELPSTTLGSLIDTDPVITSIRINPRILNQLNVTLKVIDRLSFKKLEPIFAPEVTGCSFAGHCETENLGDLSDIMIDLFFQISQLN